MPAGRVHFELNIFDHSSVAYCVTEVVRDSAGHPTDWIYRYCNQAFADLKGYSLEAMVDRSFLSLFPQMDEKWLEALDGAAYENIPCEIEKETDQTFHVSIMPIGKEGYCSVLLQRIGDSQEKTKIQPQNQKQIEIQTQDTASGSGTEESYILQKLMPEYVSLYRLELNSGKYEILRMSANTNAKQIADATHKYADFDEYTRQYADLFILEEDKKEFLEWHSCKNMKKMLCRKDKITYHYHSVSKEGNHRYYEAYAVKGRTDGDTFTIFLGYRNVDSILYKEKAIQERLKKALDEAKLGNEIISAIAKTYQYISRIDIDGDYFEEISNRDRGNLNFMNAGVQSVSNKDVCRKFVSEEYQEAFFKFTDISTLPERMEKEATIVLEYRMKNGSWHKLRFIEKKRDKTGRLTHVLCVIRSISDAKKREQELLYQVAEAKKDAAMKAKFLSNMSHDIRTPMNGILGMLDLAERYPEDLEVQKKCRNKIMESSRNLVSLVNDILDMNKLESGDFSEPELNFNLAEVLSRANTEKQILAQEKNIDYVVDWGKSDLKHMYLVGNPVYLERLLSVVADNAVKFTKPGGMIHVWCMEKSAAEDQVVYEFGCSDNGIGMSESFISHAFEMFSQERETSRSRYEGTGLGLAIAKKIAEHLGGTIELESRKDHGTTVRMTIPFKSGKEEKKKRKNFSEEIPLKGLRVLIAEDNELNMEIAKFFLEENGMVADCAMDGDESVKKFEESAPGYYDIILMDIMMPNLNGWDAARKIRSMKREDARRIPIIAMSANAFAEDIINSRISGMNQHVCKPLDESKLLTALKECMEKET